MQQVGRQCREISLGRECGQAARAPGASAVPIHGSSGTCPVSVPGMLLPLLKACIDGVGLFRKIYYNRGCISPCFNFFFTYSHKSTTIYLVLATYIISVILIKSHKGDVFIAPFYI